MALLLQKVDPDTGDVILDFNGLATQPNVPGLQVLMDPDWGAVGTQVTWLTQPPFPGGIPAVVYDPISTFSIVLRAKANTSYDTLIALAQQLQLALESGGTYKIQVDGASSFLYMDVYPSPTPQLIRGQAWGYLYIVKYLTDVDGLPLQMARHPYFRRPMLLAATNVLSNGTMLEWDGSGPPANFSWSDSTDISNQKIDYDNQAFTFRAATVATKNLYADSATAAPGDIWSAGIDVAATPSGIASLAIQIDFLDGSNALLQSTIGPAVLVSPPTQFPNDWLNRLTVTSAAAPSNTAHVQASLVVNNLSTTSVKILARKIQLELGTSATTFRAGVETVFNDVRNPFGRRMFVHNPGPVEALCRLTIGSAATLPMPGAVIMLARQSIGTLALNWILAKDTTLGADTTSGSDSNATGGHAAITAPADLNIMQKRWRWEPGVVNTGSYKVRVAIWVEDSTEYSIQGRYATFNDGVSAPWTLPNLDAGDPEATAGEYQIYTLGTVRVNQPTNLVVEGWAALIEGTGEIHWDQIILEPCEEQVLSMSRPELFDVMGGDFWLGSDLETPPTDPGGLSAGSYAGNLIVLTGNNEGCGTPPDAGITFPAGDHICRFVGSVFFGGVGGSFTQGIARVWNRTTHATVASVNLRWENIHGGVDWQGFDEVVPFTADGTSSYQLQIVSTHVSAHIDVKWLNHVFAPSFSDTDIIMDGLARVAYQTGNSDADIVSNMVVAGQYLELAPKSSQMITVTVLSTPVPGIGDADPTAPDALFDPTRFYTVGIDVIPRELMP